MKRILVALAFVALAALSSCKKNASSNSTQGKKWIVATESDFRPFEFTNDKRQFVGIDVDILSAIAKDQGFDYEMQPLDWDKGVRAVREGRADALIAGATIKQDRIDSGWIFSDAYYDATLTFAVSKNSQITKFEDLAGKRVGVKKGTAGSDYANSLKDIYGYSVVEYDSSPVVYQEVVLGNIDACVEDTPIIASNIIDKKLPLRIPVGMESDGAPYGFVIMDSKNRELLDMFNRGLKDIRANGTYKKIIDKYIK